MTRVERVLHLMTVGAIRIVLGNEAAQRYIDKWGLRS
jgi:hypothetical protein